MRRWLAGLMALVACAPAHAQLATGRSGSSDAPIGASEAEYWGMMGQMGMCLANSQGSEARAFLASSIGSVEEDGAVKGLLGGKRNRCMGNFVRASMLRPHIRGVVAEGLFERLPEEQVAAALAAPIESPVGVSSLYDVGQCYVAAHPQEAIGLLRDTDVGTQGERDYIRRIATGLGPCLPGGTELRLNPVNVRMVLAEALYHAATRSAAQPVQGMQ